MKPWNRDWRPWLYAICHMGAGPTMLAFVVWIVWPVRNKCFPGHESTCLSISEKAMTGGLLILGLVTLGLVIRSAIRSLRGTIGDVTVEAESHEEDR